MSRRKRSSQQTGDGFTQQFYAEPRENNDEQESFLSGCLSSIFYWVAAAVIFYFIFEGAVSSEKTTSVKPTTQQESAAQRESKEAVRQMEELFAARREAQRREEKERKAVQTRQQQELANDKQAAANVAVTFVNAFFKEDYAAMQGICYSSSNVDISTVISAMKIGRADVMGTLRRHQSEEYQRNGFSYEWATTVTDYAYEKIWFAFEISVDGVSYMRFNDVVADKGTDGKWYVDMASFVDRLSYPTYLH